MSAQGVLVELQREGQAFLALPLVHLGDVVITPGRLLAASLAVAVAFLLAWASARALARFERRNSGVNHASMYAVGRVVRYLLIGIGLVVALEWLGVDAGKFAVIAGALGVGLGFGLQSIFNNFISGLILLFDRSLKVGDVVELESGVHGVVRDIKIRYTRINTNDNLDILVPNSEFVSGRVVNWTHGEGWRRLHVPFGVAYGTDKAKVREAIFEAAAAVPFTMADDERRKPQLWLVGFGDSSLDFELVVWITAEATARPGAVKAAYNWEIESALARHGIEIPFPQRDLHIRSGLPHAPPTPPGARNDATEEVIEAIVAGPGAPNAEPDDQERTER